jgi:hypothetical protein
LEGELRSAGGPNSWAVWSGTSFAAPQATGRIAQRAADKGLGVRAAAAQILAEARTDPESGLVVT